MRARTALLILLILVLAVPVASGARITLEERIFLDSPGSGAVPVATSVFAGGTYIAVVASKGSDTVIYVVDPARGEVVLNRTLKDALPLCAEALGDGSLSVIVTPGKSSVEEIIVTPDLNVLSGLEYRADLPVIFSGCTHQGRNVLVYGEAVVKGRSLEAYASMLNPAGIPLATATWGGPGDQILKEVASANGMIVAAVSNTSSNRVDLYRLQLTPGSLLPVYLGSAPLLGVLLDAMVFGDGVALLEATSSTPTSGYLVVFENNESTIYPLPGGGVGLSFAGESNGHTAIVGFVPNTTTGLSDGMIALLRTGQWRLEAIDIAYGAKSVSYTCGTYAGEASVIVAGTHGDTPLLALYSVTYDAANTTTPGQAPPPEEGRGLLLPLAAGAAIVVVALLAVAIYRRATASRSGPQ